MDDYANVLRLTVALAVGFATWIGVLRILKGWPIHWLIIGGYIGVVVMTGFAPREIRENDRHRELQRAGLAGSLTRRLARSEIRANVCVVA